MRLRSHAQTLAAVCDWHFSLAKVAFALLAVCSVLASECKAGTSASQPLAALSPCALSISHDGGRIFVACATGCEVVIVDRQKGAVIQRIALPAPPSGLALSADGTQLFVTCAAVNSTVCILNTSTGKLLNTIAAGHSSMAPVLSADQRTLFVCDRFDDSVAAINLAGRTVTVHMKVQREPVAAALTPNGDRLLVANHLPSGRSDLDVVAAAVSVIDTHGRTVLKHISLPSGSTQLRGICVSPDGRVGAVTHLLARFHLPVTQVERGWVMCNALSLIDVPQMKLLNTVLLDNLDRGAANPWAVGWTEDGKFICVTHAGTHELSVLDAPALLAKLGTLSSTASPHSPPDFNSASRTPTEAADDLAFLVGLRSKIPLSGNGPRALALSGPHVWVANYFSDSIGSIDLRQPPPTPSCVPLQPAAVTSLPRQGERLFNDATLCFQSWLSCASCHSSDARVDGLNWDLLNDGVGNPKNSKSLLL